MILKGVTKQVLDNMVEEGYANTRSEAIRLAILRFGDEHFSEAELVNRKLDRIDSEIKQGKRRLLKADAALGKYSKHLK